ncbi:MAG: cysteine desulfurase-like protein [Kofleriaceae bacterium]
MLDLASVRGAFPALASGHVFLDNAGGSQTLRAVAERVSDYLLTSNVQHGASYAVSQRAMERVAAAITATTHFMGARSSEEIVVGPSTTQLLINLASSMAGVLQPGDEIIITEADHEANRGPWKRLAGVGATIKVWPIDRATWTLEPSGLAPLLSERTKLVAFTHCTNLLGTIHDVSALTRVIHDAGAMVCVDGVGYAPHRELRVAEWDVDYYVFSAYKVFGPHLGVLYGKRELLDALPTINHDFITTGAYKLQPGNLNFELTYSLLGLYQYLAGFGGPARAFADFAEHEEALTGRLLERLAELPGVTLHGERDPARDRRVSTVSFSVAGRAPAEIVSAVDEHKIGIRHGDFYARALARALAEAAGQPDPAAGVIRVSMAHYNTLEEIDRAADAISDAITRGPRAA